MMTLSINGSSIRPRGEKRCTVITLSSSNQPVGCSFAAGASHLKANAFAFFLAMFVFMFLICS
jgi:hypothetical protein